MSIKRMPVAQFVHELEAALNRGDGYIMGAYGQNPRTGYLDLSVTTVKSAWKTTGHMYTQYSGKQRTQALEWRKKCTRVWDCNGLAEGIYELYTGTCINSYARSNYANWCGTKGKGLIPAAMRKAGVAVFWSDGSAGSIHHVAYLYKPVKASEPQGDWYIIEARGVMYGVVKTKLSARKPNYWGIMDKYFDYGIDTTAPTTGTTAPTTAPTTGKLGDRILKNGTSGADVKQMQENLIRLGYDLGKWGADGDFGDATEMAVRRFQTQESLAPDGEFGPLSLAAMNKALARLNAPVEQPKQVQIVGGNCYVRSSPAVEKANIRGIAHEGTQYPFTGQKSENGWLQIVYKDKAGWVSGKYGRLVE